MAASLFAEFDRAEAILAAAEHLRALGYRRVLGYTPFPMPELEEVIGLRRSRIPRAVFVAGLTGAIVAYLILWFCNAVDYPLDVGGRPLNSIVTDVPIVFETTILFAGLCAFFAALFTNGLPRLHDDVSAVAGIERTSVDRYWLRVEKADAHYDPGVVFELRRLGALEVHEEDVR